MLDLFAEDYESARLRFRAAASAAGCRLKSHVLSGRGSKDEELAIDVAILEGSDSAIQTTVILSSGVHGVEGFFGSAVQSAWLMKPPALPRGVRVVLVHAANPYGFSWGRRWNENGVDLNRAFLQDRAFLTDDPAYTEGYRIYQRLDTFLNPASPPSRSEPYLLKAIAVILTLGMGKLKKTLPVGQYERPGGLFYGGGEKPEWTVNVFRENLVEWCGGAARVIHLDLHTGLGAYGGYKLLIDESADSEGAEWMRNRFGAQYVESALEGETAYKARGTLLVDCRTHLESQGIEYKGAVAEFGTYSGVRVLGALRAENRAYHYGKPNDATSVWARQQVREAFCPATPDWRESALRKGLALVNVAVATP